jgi:hypothetical protein
MSRKTLRCLIALVLAVQMLLVGLTAPVAQADGPTDWAILISGGINQGSNNARYWNDISEMYEILIDTYGYNADEVFFLYADGNPPTATNCHDHTNADASYPTDVIDYAATSANLDTVTDTIAANGHPCDTLFVFATDHGGTSGGQSTLCLWGENMTAATFAGAGYMGDITQYCWRAFEMEQCHSGGFVGPLSGPKTAIATACAADESSFAMWPPPPYYDEFCYYFNAALKGEKPDGTAVNADANSDGKVSFVEAYNYAEANDKYSPPGWEYGGDTYLETPQYDDNGDGVSQTGQMPTGGDGAFGSQIFLGERLNDPPVADAGTNQILEQAYYQGADVTLDGSGSSDDGCIQALAYTWTWTGGSDSGVIPTVSLPLGMTTVTLSVDDGQYIDTDTVDITVIDTTPPVVDAGVDITVEQTSYDGAPADLPDPVVTDICDPDPYVVVSGTMAIYPLGDTVVTVTATDASGNVASDTIVVHVVDTTPPEVACIESVNPRGMKVPPAGNTTLPKPKGGQNEDGFYLLEAVDICDPDPMIFVEDTGSGYLFGPFTSGDIIKYTEDAVAVPEMKKMGSDKGKAGAVTKHIIGTGDACVTAVDFSGNVAACVSCLVPSLPK